ncbi:hypothetical protein [Coleofasciculus sp.]|uniref:hypothetical protein n=1 Tax=Coleofasciculus sp. TaxID=3100458 RepID=UPI003A2ABCBB
MNKLIGLIIIAAALVGAALGWQGVSLPFFGELFGGENRTANQIIESVPDTTDEQETTQPAAQAPTTIGTAEQAPTNQETAQAPQTTVGQADTGADTAAEDSEPVTALW